MRSLEIHPFEAYGRPIRAPSTDSVYARAQATAAENIKIPSGAKYVRLSMTHDHFLLFGTTTAAAAVAGDTTDGTASEHFSAAKGEHWRYCSTGDFTGISVITQATAAPVITATFYTE
jgi:hypothetical protein